MREKISKELDNGQNTGMILIDLQKTFDTIDHGLLLKTMPQMGQFKKYVRFEGEGGGKPESVQKRTSVSIVF